MVRATHRRSAVLGLIASFLLSTLTVVPAAADSTAQSIPFSQDWTNTGLITTNDDWSGVPGVVGYLGESLTSSTAVDPQTVVADGSGTSVDVIANQTSTSITNGGVAEFEIADPVVALQGSGTADAPHLLLALDTTSRTNIRVAYSLRDIDGSADDAVQPVALQYRVGSTGDFTNVPAAFIADATTGPSEAFLVTNVGAFLPNTTWNQSLVQVRIITTNAGGSDEWVGVDNLSVTSVSGDTAPAVQSTDPANGTSDVPVSSSISVTFNEAVNLAADGIAVTCDATPVAGTQSGGPVTFTFDPTTDLPAGASCTIEVAAEDVTDADTNDPPDFAIDDFSSSFTTAAVVELADVVISQVYGGGGNSGATLTNDFIELFNRGSSSVSIAGWSVQYASAAGSTWQVTPLSGTIPAGGYYLVQEAAGAGGTTPLPTPDANGSIPMSATNGKVALVAIVNALSGTCPTDAAIADFVGFGSANCFEGSAAAPVLSNTTAAFRADDGCTDTDDNSADFSEATPAPRNSASPFNPCDGSDVAPNVTGTSPTDGATGVPLDASITVSFSEQVALATDTIGVTCDSGVVAGTTTGGPTDYTFDPTADFAQGEDCTAVVSAAGVTDVDIDDPPDTMTADYSFSFRTFEDICLTTNTTAIHDIQGNGATSPIVGETVTIRGVVVGDYQASTSFNGFHVQEEDADVDADPATSEGIFVFEGSSAVDVAAGDVVAVIGTVVEFTSSGITLTELTDVSQVQVCSSGASVTPATVSLPFDSLTYAERFEGMLVTIDQELTVTETFTLGRFGEAVLSSGGRLQNPTNVVEPGAPANELQAANDRNRIVLDDGDNRQNIDPTLYPDGGLSAANTLRVGDTTPGGTFVLEQRFGVYRLQPTAELPDFISSNPRPVEPAAVGGDLQVASFNVLNYFDTLDIGPDSCGPAQDQECRGADSAFELERQRAKIVAALAGLDADIVGLIELENDPGGAVEDLLAALNTATAPGTYDFIDTGTIGEDAIKVALIYKPSAVTPVGDPAILDSSLDARFDDTLNRPALAQAFDSNDGGRLTVVVNHLKSKGSACAGDPDMGDGQGNCNVTRTMAAEALVDWLASDPTGSGDLDALVIGDLNAYAKEDPIDVFVEAGYTNLIEQFGGPDAYSFVFQGQSGYLDHALASPTLAAQVTGAVDWHINADEPIVLDYNVEFKGAGHIETLYAPTPYRSSDHDPVLVGLDLLDFGFDGFGAPVADPPALNAVNPGATVPLKFTLSGISGLDVLFSDPVSFEIDCATGVAIGDPVPTTSDAGLTLDTGTGQYKYEWKTLKSFEDSCRTFRLTFDDGAYVTADFDFRK